MSTPPRRWSAPSPVGVLLAAAALALGSSPAWAQGSSPANASPPPATGPSEADRHTVPPQPAGPAVPVVAPPAPAAPAADEGPAEVTIHLRDGRSFTGLVERRDEDQIVLRIAGIPTPFPTADVEAVTPLEPLMDRYLRLREAVGDDPDQIVTLARWLQARDRYELALGEVRRALAIDRAHPDAIKLRTLLEQQILLKARGTGRPEAAPAAEPPPPARPIDNFPLLSEEDVNLIKVYEVNLADNPRLIIPRKTVAAMLDKYAGHPLVPITREGREALERRPPAETLALMFKLQAREFYRDVQVLDQPKPFVVLRDGLQRNWLINACATSACHGGSEAGRLVLMNRRPNADRSLFTNFLIMSRYRLDDGSPLIDFERPELSPLLQMGLPRDKSRRPHPVVPAGVAGRDAFKPVFRSMDDRQFEAAVAWIKSLYRPRPNYPIDYPALRPLTPAAATTTPSTPGPGGSTPASPEPAPAPPAPAPTPADTMSPPAAPASKPAPAGPGSSAPAAGSPAQAPGPEPKPR